MENLQLELAKSLNQINFWTRLFNWKNEKIRILDSFKKTIEAEEKNQKNLSDLVAEVENLKYKTENYFLNNSTKTLEKGLDNISEFFFAKNKNYMNPNFSEEQLGSLLENMGFVDKVTLFKKDRISNLEGNEPDYRIIMPDKSEVIIDSKVGKDKLALNKHIKDLNTKSYHTSNKSDNTVAFTIMYVGNEAKFLDIVNKDANLISDAYRKNVIIASNSLIAPCLFLISTIQRNYKQLTDLGNYHKALNDAHSTLMSKIKSLHKDYDTINKSTANFGKTLESFVSKDNRVNTLNREFKKLKEFD